MRPDGASRRRVLKTIGAGSTLVVGTKGVAAQRGKTEFVGVQYDTLSKDVVGFADADIARPPSGQFKGVLNLEGVRVPVNLSPEKQTPMSEVPGPVDGGKKRRYSTVKRGENGRLVSNGRPLNLSLTSIDDGTIGGLVRHSQTDKRAILLRPKPKSKTDRQVRNEIEQWIQQFEVTEVNK